MKDIYAFNLYWKLKNRVSSLFLYTQLNIRRKNKIVAINIRKEKQIFNKNRETKQNKKKIMFEIK